MVTNRDPGGLYRTNDACSKTGRSVIDILREKHPEHVVPDASHFDQYDERTTTECQTSMPVYCSEDEVTKVAKTLGGCAGPTGVDGIMLRGWVLHKGVPSQKFR